LRGTSKDHHCNSLLVLQLIHFLQVNACTAKFLQRCDFRAKLQRQQKNPSADRAGVEECAVKSLRGCLW